MDIIQGIILIKMQTFILILVRVTSLFMVSPIFGKRNLPSIFKIGFSCMIAVILVNIVNIPASVNLNSMYDFTLVVLKEFIVGVILGYISFLIFTSIYLAGQLIDTQIGFGIVSVIDPLTNIQVPLTANFYYALAMVIFFTINGHHMLIEALAKSFDIIPIGTAVLSNTIIPQMVKILEYMFIIGFKISVPIIAAILLTDVVLGILARTMPQMNVFMVGLPLKIIVGLIVIMITIPAFLGILGFMVDSINEQSITIMKEMTLR